MPQAMAALQQRWVTAVLSNADDDYLFPQIKRLGLSFPVVLSSEMVGAYKPHPLPFQRVLEELGDNALMRRYMWGTTPSTT